MATAVAPGLSLGAMAMALITITMPKCSAVGVR